MTDDEIATLVDRLRSHIDPQEAANRLATAGPRAVAPLRALLVERDTSGVFEPRQLAAQVLHSLGEDDTLLEFVTALHPADSAVEDEGNAVAVSAAGRLLSGSQDPNVRGAIYLLAAWHPPRGVIAALGSFGQADAIPLLIDALYEDFTRAAAEDALRALGSTAVPALIAIAQRGAPNLRESESRLRQRRSAIGLLAEIGVSERERPAVLRLTSDADQQIAVTACVIGLTVGTPVDQRDAIAALISFAGLEDAVIRAAVHDGLVEAYPVTRAAIEAAIGQLGAPAPWSADRRRLALLRAVQADAASICQGGAEPIRNGDQNAAGAQPASPHRASSSRHEAAHYPRCVQRLGRFSVVEGRACPHGGARSA
jgi:hypothetical protein